MRQCIVVIGSERQQEADIPTIRQGEDQVVRQTFWYACKNQDEPTTLLDDIEGRSRCLRSLALIYPYYLHVSGVKTWSGRRPLVLVQGNGPAAKLAARVAPWAGGDPVQFESEQDALLPQTRYILRADGSLEMLA